MIKDFLMILIFLVFLFIFTFFVLSSKKDFALEMDALLKKEGFNGAVLVAKKGKIALDKA